MSRDSDYSPAYFQFGRFLATSPDRSQLAMGRQVLKEYLERDPRGMYASEAQRLSSN
jgi:hypothetical protein